MCPAICCLLVRHHSLSSFGGASRGRGPLLLDLNSWSHRKSADQNSNPPLSFSLLAASSLLGPHAHSVPLPPPPHLSRQGSAPCYHTFIIPYLEWCLGSRVRTPLRCLVGGKGPVGHPNRGHHRAHDNLFWHLRSHACLSSPHRSSCLCPLLLFYR